MLEGNTLWQADKTAQGKQLPWVRTKPPGKRGCAAKSSSLSVTQSTRATEVRTMSNPQVGKEMNADRLTKILADLVTNTLTALPYTTEEEYRGTTTRESERRFLSCGAFTGLFPRRQLVAGGPGQEDAGAGGLLPGAGAVEEHGAHPGSRRPLLRLSKRRTRSGGQVRGLSAPAFGVPHAAISGFALPSPRRRQLLLRCLLPLQVMKLTEYNRGQRS
ncbi:hypothetical protein BHE74_00040326 [Ensete ventricosum]|nr:hypothetical protein BHE74_00040326 [Ensete ventricosum]